jgi:hypothetical protein
MNEPIPLALDARRTRDIDPPPILATCSVATEALADALVPVALPDPVDPLIVESIVAALRWVFGRELSITEAAAVVARGPRVDAATLAELDERARVELVRAGVMISLADQRRDPARTQQLVELARTLAIDPARAGLDHLELITAGKLGRFRLRLFDASLREILPPDKELGRASLWWQVIGSMFGVLRPKQELAARFEALAAYPRDSVGWALHRHYRVHGFPTPGEARGFSELIVPHELAHVLSGYEPHPYGEMLVAAFHAGNSPGIAMPTLLLGMLQYHHGIKVDFRPERGLLVPDEFFRAYARGCATPLDLHAVDWTTLIDRKLDELRLELGFAPRRERLHSLEPTGVRNPAAQASATLA